MAAMQHRIPGGSVDLCAESWLRADPPEPPLAPQKGYGERYFSTTCRPNAVKH